MLAVQEGQDREPIVRTILEAVTTLSARLEVLTLMRSRNQALGDWLAEDSVAALESEWREAVRRKLQQHDARWSIEYALLRVLHLCQEVCPGW